MKASGITHAIGTPTFPAPQATLMATLVKGLMSNNLDWQYVLVGSFIAVTMELCGIKALSFAVGLYLPLSTTLPIFIGGAVRGLSDKVRGVSGGGKHSSAEDELGKGNLFATGLVAGGALAGVIVAMVIVGIEKADESTLDSEKKARVAANQVVPDQGVLAAEIKDKLWKPKLEAMSFERNWEQQTAKQLEAQHPEMTADQVESMARSQTTPAFNLLGVGLFALMAIVLFLISLRK
jgi:hypothetical protein